MSGRRVLFVVICCALLLNLALAALGRLFVDRGLVPANAAPAGAGATRDFLYFRQGTDSWQPMLDAATLHQEGRPVYQTLFFERKVKFQYPLTSVLPLIGARRLGMGDADILAAAGIASWLAVWATIGMGIATAMGLRRDWWLALAIGLAGITFYPVVRGYSLGQIQVFLTMLFAFALWFWTRGRQAPAGVVIGVMALIKPQYALLALWFALRKRTTALAAAAGVMAAGFGAALLVFGWREQLRYLDVLGFIGRRGEAYFPNLSFNGLANRLLFNGSNLEWNAHAYAPYHPWVYAVTLGTSAVILALALRPGRRGDVFDLGAMMVAATAASPIAWEHHHAILFPLFAVIAATPRAYRWAIPLAAAYALTANSWAPLNALAGIPLLNGLQSVPLAGVLIVFLLLGRLSGKPGATMPGPSGLPEQELIVCTATPASRLP